MKEDAVLTPLVEMYAANILTLVRREHVNGNTRPVVAFGGEVPNLVLKWMVKLGLISLTNQNGYSCAYFEVSDGVIGDNFSFLCMADLVHPSAKYHSQTGISASKFGYKALAVLTKNSCATLSDVTAAMDEEDRQRLALLVKSLDA